MKKTPLIALTMTIALLGCQTNQNRAPSNAVKGVDSHTSELALDWDGFYNGFLPCASCPGILTTIKLNNDKTFEKIDFYLGEKGGYFNEKGSIAFTKNGNNIVLKPKTGQKTMYAVMENKLALLNKDGSKASSELTKMYELKKTANEEVVFNDKPIKGLLTFGHEVSSFRPCSSMKIYWIQDVIGGTLTKMYQQKLGKTPIPYTPVIAELLVKDVGKAKEGFAEQYDGVLQVVKINSVDLIDQNNHCGS